jgi:aldehyde:ferredoxin oxidoreductase
MTYSFKTADFVGDPDLEAKTFRAVTGRDGEEMELYAERLCNLQRALQVREGRKLPDDDFPHDFNFTEPLPALANGRKILVPGPGDTTVDATGNRLDRDRFNHMLKEYYSLRGWDKDTGLPHAETLANLDLEDIATDFR